MRALATAVMLALAIVCASGPGPAVAAVEPDEILADPALEARARDLGKELRCVVCQNQSIDDSAAPLARDLRLLVRERLVAGDSDREVLDYITARYGDYVLLRPPFKATTYVLWLGPAVVFALGLGVVLVMTLRRRRAETAPTPPLSADEEARLRRLIEDGGS